MLKPYMKISEYLIRPDLPVPTGIIDKIYTHHAFPVSYVRHLLGHPVIVSKSSGYRPEEHELSKGRNGITEHLFKPLDRPGSEGHGAADYRTALPVMAKFVKLLSEHTQYTRICFYPNVTTPFLHTDYRFYGSETKYYISSGGSWNQVSLEEIIKRINKVRKTRNP